MTEAGVIPHHGPREVGCGQGTTEKFDGRRKVLRVGVVEGRVMLAISMEVIYLDADQREEFMRLWCEAERQAEGGDRHVSQFPA